jgi:hypothetical protein
VRGVFAAAALLVLVSGAFGGCAGIAGLSAFSDGECNGGDCGASADAGIEVGGGDSASGLDGPPGSDGSLSADVVLGDAVIADVVHDTASSDAVASCNATSCPSGCTTHSDGLGQTYTDCHPPYSSSNPWTETAAFEACAAFTGDPTVCTSGWKCSGGESVCSSGQKVCDCWEYSGPSAGQVNGAGKCDCVLPTDPSWD